MHAHARHTTRNEEHSNAKTKKIDLIGIGLNPAAF